MSLALRRNVYRDLDPSSALDIGVGKCRDKWEPFRAIQNTLAFAKVQTRCLDV